MSETTRINLTVRNKDLEVLRRIYKERYLPYRLGDVLSFTGFCCMMLMFSAEVVEETDYVFSYTPSVRRPGRPKEVDQ